MQIKIAVFATLAASLFFPFQVFADGTYSGCDYTQANTSFGSVNTDLLCNAFSSFSFTGNLGGITFNIDSFNSGGTTPDPVYIVIADRNGGPNLGSFTVPLSSLAIGSNTIDIAAHGAFSYSPPQIPEVKLCSDSACTTNAHITTLAASPFAYPYISSYWYWNSSPPPADTSTRIVPLEPSADVSVATTTTSTSVPFSIQYYNNSADTLSANGFQYDRMALYLSRVDAASSTQVYFDGVPGDTLTSTSTTMVLPTDSAWNYTWCFEGLAPWGYVSGLCSPTQNLFVISNPLPVLIGATSTSDLTGLATTTCSIVNPTGCVQNAVAFLFYPNSSVFENFKTLQGSVRSHAPFGYVYTMISAINGTSGSTTPNFILDIATTTQAVFFSPIRSGISAILWALAAFWFFKRIRDLHL